MRPALLALLAGAALGGAALAVALARERGADEPRRAEGRPSAAASGPPRPALCRARRGALLGTVADPEAAELSGLAASRRVPALLWSHNDSGGEPRLWALRPDGRVLGRPLVSGAQAVDWEDLAAGPGPDVGARLYIGDIGDNGAVRPAIDVYRVDEPPPGAAATAPAARLRLRYPDGRHDAEALLVDPRRGTLAVVTKALASARLYTASAALPAGATATLRRGPSLRLGLVTGGDVSADGRVVALRTYGSLHLWARRGDEPLTRTLRRVPCTMPAPLPDLQGEAVALSRHGGVAWTVSEGSPAALRRYPAP